MKQLSIFFFLFFFLTACSSQMLFLGDTKAAETSSLNHALSEYTEATIHNKVDKLMTFVYPKVFTIVSQKQMVYLLNKMYTSGKAPKITKIMHKKISDIQRYDEGQYAIILSDMYMELPSPVVDNPEYEMLLYVMLKKRMGSDSIIEFDKRRHLYKIKKDSKIIGINENNEGWKFVGYEQAQKYATKNIIPQQITRHLQ